MSLAKISINGPYKSPHGLFLGVIRGLADHYKISPFYLRLAVILISLLLAFWPMVIIYFAAAIVMPKEPKVRPTSERAKETVLLGRADPKALVEGLVNRSNQIEKKLRRLEDYITSKPFRTKNDYRL
ncbi:MAG: PspC domain-containing protein [Deltaproteobacteria bacterium]|jgi:phage shock protein C|nr:PspC domain-containing protein [Deltaproteobacteria bacterium]